MSTIHPNYVLLDAGPIFGATPHQEPLPAPEEGAITLHVPKLTKEEIVSSIAGRHRIPISYEMIDARLWSPPKPGTYEIHMPIDKSNLQTLHEQSVLLREGQEVIEFSLALIAMTCLIVTGKCENRLLNGSFTRTALRQDADSVAIGFLSGRLTPRTVSDSLCALWLFTSAAARLDTGLSEPSDRIQ